jgi:hypothetical protein
MTRIDEILNQSELFARWGKDKLRYGAYIVPRAALDEDSDGPDAMMIIGIDDAGIRRHEELYDPDVDRLTQAQRAELKELAAETHIDSVRQTCEDILGYKWR